MAYSIATEELNYYKRAYEESSEEDSGFSKILGNSEAMQKLKEKAMRVARKDFPVLITGETGTGKELLHKRFTGRAAEERNPSSVSIVPPFRQSYWKVNCLDMTRVHLPERKKAARLVSFSWQTAERFFWMRSAICRWQCRQSCCVYFRKARLKSRWTKKCADRCACDRRDKSAVRADDRGWNFSNGPVFPFERYFH